MDNRMVQLKAAVISLLLMLVFFLNPFGLRSASEKYNEDLIIGFNAPLFPLEAQAQLAVVLLDEAFIRHYAGRYPVDYSSLNQLLIRIAHYQPKAVFFDILQYYPSSNYQSLWTERLRKSNQKFPVFMASIPHMDRSEYFQKDSGLRQSISAASQLSAVGWSDYQHYYPLNFQLDGKAYRSAAMDLYRIWCLSEPSVCPYSDEDLVESGRFTAPMIVQWSNQAAENQSDFAYLPEGVQCQPRTLKAEQSTLIRLYRRLQSLRDNFLALFHSGLSGEALKKSVAYPCPQVLTISATKFFQDDQAAKLRRLQQRLVLVGYGIEGSPDLVESPVNGSLAGVFLHAVALDNLINFGENYWHVPATIDGLGINVSDLIEGILQTIFLYAALYYRFHYLENSALNAVAKPHQHHWKGLIMALLAILLTFLCVLSAYQYLKYGPVNWYAFILILLTIIPTFLHQLFAQLMAFYSNQLTLFKCELLHMFYSPLSRMAKLTCCWSLIKNNKLILLALLGLAWLTGLVLTHWFYYAAVFLLSLLALIGFHDLVSRLMKGK
ncbi:CHASE2 domain-containing protein [Agarivorans sp. Z349TD_8]|uniref:CHASE2 domain-containing protein n=1 Tax=Agarivorans sp. Z349TD_8 TaxID=3421434 RepID=UPI003D7E5299